MYIRRSDGNLSVIKPFHLLKFQQRQVDKFCRKYNLSHTAGQLPSDNSTSSTLNRHVLVNDKAQTLFCFAPKTGCTNLRIIFFLVMGKWLHAHIF